MAQPIAIGVLTSGGDAQGMNAALRAVVRTALARDAHVYAIYEGYQGMVEGGDRIQPLDWDDVGGILHLGGTIIGTARSADFRTREGRLKAARNLVACGIDRLVIIGGDGSLTGANLFRQEWTDLLDELLAQDLISAAARQRHSHLAIVGLVGSIDNDMYGTDMTIGADSALHRITEALDALASTAASHQRAFVVEVMGRHCGYLALIGGISGGADYVLIPEKPPEGNWEDDMCTMLRAGRDAGRRDSIVVLAEGARDADGNDITADRVKQVLEERLGEDTRVTILGHVQRGGTPSAFDRWMSTLIGSAAVDEVLQATSESIPQLIGMRYNRVTRTPLMHCVEQTHAVAKVIAEKRYDEAMKLRGGSFSENYRIFQTLAQAQPTKPQDGAKRRRIAIIHGGDTAPGMNTAVRAATRVGLDKGHAILGVYDGFHGLAQGKVKELAWNSVAGWGSQGGANMGTNSRILPDKLLGAVAETIEQHNIDALLMIGGWPGYENAYQLHQARDRFTALDIPIICLPATIANNLPGAELSVGADTALNSIVEAIDKIKQSAAEVGRCFIVEVLGQDCGYLALMSGLAAGAEQVYLPEEGITLQQMVHDIKRFGAAFRNGKRLGLIIRSQNANPIYTTSFICNLFEEEGGDHFDARQAILGHLQKGGMPSPFDRGYATRLAVRCIEHLLHQLEHGTANGSFIGLSRGKLNLFQLNDFPSMVDLLHHRPSEQWWMALRPIANVLAHQAE